MVLAQGRQPDKNLRTALSLITFFRNNVPKTTFGSPSHRRTSNNNSERRLHCIMQPGRGVQPSSRGYFLAVICFEPLRFVSAFRCTETLRDVVHAVPVRGRFVKKVVSFVVPTKNHLPTIDSNTKVCTISEAYSPTM